MCPEKSILSAFFDGEVDLQWSTEIEKHLAECDHCSHYISELKSQRELLISLDTPEFIDSLDLIKYSIRERQTVSHLERFWEKQISLPIAAAAAILAASIAFGSNMLRDNTNDQFALSSAQREVVDQESIAMGGNSFDEIFKGLESDLNDEFSSNTIVELPDNVDLTLNGDSQMLRSVGFQGSGSH